MTGAAIIDGDLVVVRRQEDAENGEIVAARIGGEATVKTLQRRGGHAWLMPHNPAFQPIPADDAAIMGKIVSVVRPPGHGQAGALYRRADVRAAGRTWGGRAGCRAGPRTRRGPSRTAAAWYPAGR